MAKSNDKSVLIKHKILINYASLTDKTMMERRLLFLMIIVIQSAFADIPPYDTNCVELGQSQGWIKTYDPNKAWLRSYNDEKIKNDFHLTQNQISTQLKGWEKLGQEGVLCFQKLGGFTFENGQFLITDFSKFQAFRLNQSKIDCFISEDTEFNSSKTLSQKNEMVVAPAESTQTYIRNLKGQQEAIQNFKMSPWEKNQKLVFDELNKIIKNNNAFGDLGLSNYCSHQLFLGSPQDQAKQWMKSLDHCQNAREKGDLKTLQNKVCGGYPEVMQKKLDQLKKSMDQIDKDINEQNKKSMNQKALNQTDFAVYSQFKNNHEALKKAQKKAKDQMNLGFHDENYKQAALIYDHTKKLNECGQMENYVFEQFDRGINCYDPLDPVTNMTVEFNRIVDQVKDENRDKLIEEMNLNVYRESMKALYLLSSPEERQKMSTDPVATCSRQTMNVKLCTSPYIEMYRQGVQDGKTKEPDHFFNLKDQEVITFLNSDLNRLKNLCEQSHKICKPEIKQKFIKTSNDYGNDLTYLPNETEECVQLQKEMNQVKIEMQHQNYAAYFYTDAVGETINFESINAQKECRNIDPDDLVMNQNILNEAKEEFKKAIMDQLLTITDNTKADRGHHSNSMGANICNVEMNEKNDLYALVNQYKGYPLMMGRLLKGMDANQKEMYSTLICDALSCQDSLNEVHDDLMTAAKIGAMGLSLIPGVGPLISIGAYASIEAGETIQKYDQSKTELKQMKSSIAVGGIENKEYNESIGQYVKNLSQNASEMRLISNLAKTLVLALASGGTMSAVKNFNHLLSNQMKGILNVESLTPLQEAMVKKFSSSIIEKTTTAAKDAANGELNSASFSVSMKEIVFLVASVKSPVLKNVKESHVDVTSLVVDTVTSENYNQSILNTSEFWSATKKAIQKSIKTNKIK